MNIHNECECECGVQKSIQHGFVAPHYKTLKQTPSNLIVNTQQSKA